MSAGKQFTFRRTFCRHRPGSPSLLDKREDVVSPSETTTTIINRHAFISHKPKYSWSHYYEIYCPKKNNTNCSSSAKLIAHVSGLRSIINRWAWLHNLKKKPWLVTLQHTQRFYLYYFYPSGTFIKLRKATISVVTSVRQSAWNNSAPSGGIFIKVHIWVFFEKSVQKIQTSLKYDKNNGNFTRIWRPSSYSDKMFQTKSKHISCSITFFFRK
jgi:hypothetical protein